MRELIFNANGMRLRKDANCNFSGIVPGSKNYLQARFDLDEEWNDCVVVAEFKDEAQNTDATLVKNNICIIPACVLKEKSFEVRIMGKRPNGYYISTNRVKVLQGG